MGEARTAVGAAWLADRLREPARDLGLELRQDVLEGLARYATLLLEWGRRVNLTGARTSEALADVHLVDALALLPDLDDLGAKGDGATRLVDVGSGGGLPGMVLAIARPELDVTLLEPLQRRHAFLRQVVRAGPAPNARPLRERLEEHRASADFRPFDAAVSRATFPLPEWLERARALVRPGGCVLGFEGAAGVELPADARRRPYRRGGPAGDRPERAVVRLDLPA